MKTKKEIQDLCNVVSLYLEALGFTVDSNVMAEIGKLESGTLHVSARFGDQAVTVHYEGSDASVVSDDPAASVTVKFDEHTFKTDTTTEWWSHEGPKEGGFLAAHHGAFSTSDVMREIANLSQKRLAFHLSRDVGELFTYPEGEKTAARFRAVGIDRLWQVVIRHGEDWKNKVDLSQEEARELHMALWRKGLSLWMRMPNGNHFPWEN